MWDGKNVILGISGGIAAYKALYLLRLLKKAGANVKVVVTKNALEFVTRVSLESLSGNRIYSSVFGAENDFTTEHISLTDWADVMIVAPATANIIGKLASGIADDALSTTLLAFNKPIFVAPAMNEKMHDHFSTQRNIAFLKSNGIHFIEPASGFLACGWEGKGRMEEPDEIFKIINEKFFSALKFAGKKVLITAGPTFEAIDPVRFIGNHSSGKMGFALAEAFLQSGAEVTIIAGPVSIKSNSSKLKRIDVMSASDMYEACKSQFADQDYIVMAAAVADYAPEIVAERKLKKKDDDMVIKLKKNPDILSYLGQNKNLKTKLIGFALETNDEEANALDKLRRKNLDAIVLNSLKNEGAGFGYDTNKVCFYDQKGQKKELALASKKEIAFQLVDLILQL